MQIAELATFTVFTPSSFFLFFFLCSAPPPPPPQPPPSLSLSPSHRKGRTPKANQPGVKGRLSNSGVGWVGRILASVSILAPPTHLPPPHPLPTPSHPAPISSWCHLPAHVHAPAVFPRFYRLLFRWNWRSPMHGQRDA